MDRWTKVLLALGFCATVLTSCASLPGSEPVLGKLDPADPNTPVILETERTTFTCEQYVNATLPFRRQQHLAINNPETYQPVDPIVWEGITQLRWTVGEACADPQGRVTVDMATIPAGAADFITNFILTGSIR